MSAASVARAVSVHHLVCTLLITLAPILPLSAGCDPGPASDDGAPGLAAAEVDTTTSPAPDPAPGGSGSLTDPNEPCSTGCLRRWQICNKEGRRRPTPENPSGGACEQTAAACLAACPSALE